MKERPILFQGEMIRAVLAGIKTQTRRLVAGHPHALQPLNIGCPYGAPGDFLYAKEAAWLWCRREVHGTTPTGRPKLLFIPFDNHVRYQATGPKPTAPPGVIAGEWRLKPGRFLPRWASRITLEVVGVRVERLQAITEDDAKAEGVVQELADSHRQKFSELWESINGKRAPWDSNPWVWVIEFRVLEPRKAGAA